ncbi:tRNA 2-thiouridine(34) synthase MnmA [Chloroflexota bacterium]
MPRKRAVVAMSGGVDSSIAASLLKEAGYEVIGVTMQIWPPDKQAFGGCCGLEAVEDAKTVAYKLDIPHYVMNFRDIFARRVIDDFCQEYRRGRTPNPCIRCNQYVKFDALLAKTKELDADFIATGHYARIEQTANGYRLLKATDGTKDQSYFLYTLGQRELQHLLLPLGNIHKTEVRRLATKLGLPVADRRDSQDICFVTDNDYRSFIKEYIRLEPGEIADTNGRVLGRHGGLALYTVGQRQGLGLTSDKRMYVLKLDASSNRLVVGTEDELSGNMLFANKLSWVAGEAPMEPVNLTAKIRYRSTEVAAQLHFRNGIAEVQFQQPQRAITPGQAIVFYRDETVLGGGIIESV